MKKLGCDEIAVTEIQPGFVDTALAKGDHLFWTASPEKAVRTNHQRCAEEEDARIYYEEMAADLLDFKMSSLEVQP